MRAPKSERLVKAMRTQTDLANQQFAMLSSVLARQSIMEFVVLRALGSGALDGMTDDDQARLRAAIANAREHAANAADAGPSLHQFIDTFEPYAA